MQRVRTVCWLAVLIPLSCVADLNEDLLAAVRKGDAERVKALLTQGADVNAKSPYGATPLFFAADRGNMEIIKILLDHGADVKVKDTFYGASAMTWAIMKGNADVMTLLLRKGAPGADDALMFGAEKGNNDVVKAALERKSEIKPEMLSSALVTATKEKHFEVADLLRRAGVELPVKPNYQIDPQVLKSYAGTYSGERFDLKFQIASGKLAGGMVGEKPDIWDAVNANTFQHPEQIEVKLTFESENGKVVSVTVAGFDDKPMVFKKTGEK